MEKTKYANVCRSNCWITGEELDLVLKEFERKLPIWVSGLEKPSQADRLAFAVLKSAGLLEY